MERIMKMIKCTNCGHDMRCTFTVDDPVEDNKVLRRKVCPSCGSVVFTREEIYRIVKDGEPNEELQEIKTRT